MPFPIVLTLSLIVSMSSGKPIESEFCIRKYFDNINLKMIFFSVDNFNIYLSGIVSSSLILIIVCSNLFLLHNYKGHFIAQMASKWLKNKPKMNNFQGRPPEPH